MRTWIKCNILWLLITSGNIKDTKYFDCYLKKSSEVQVFTVHEGPNITKSCEHDGTCWSSCGCAYSNIIKWNLNNSSPGNLKILTKWNLTHQGPYFYLHFYFWCFTHILRNSLSYQDYTVVYIKASLWPILISHVFSWVTGSSCMTKVHVSTLFQKTSSLLHYVMEQSQQCLSQLNCLRRQFVPLLPLQRDK